MRIPRASSFNSFSFFNPFNRFGFSSSSLTLVLTLLTMLSWANLPCAAQTGSAHEYALKAGVLFHIIEYVEWPGASASSNAPTIQIGLLGQIPYAEALEVLDGKTIQGRKLVVKRISDAKEAAQCQVVFFGASEKSRISEIITELNNRPILTVGDFEGFAEQGGMVNLVAGPNRIVMEINREVASQARLSLSSQLLKLAKLVSR
jgi:hypothetical protein